MSNLDPLKETYIYECTQMLETAENSIINDEAENSFSVDSINDIFRAMHTIKGSSAMMGYNNISTLTHSIEDIFYYIRENENISIDFSELADLVLEAIDFTRGEIAVISEGDEPASDASELEESIKKYLSKIKSGKKSRSSKKNNKKKIEVDTKEQSIKIIFDDDCQMVNVRAFTVLKNLKEIIEVEKTDPEDILSEDSDEYILENGFVVFAEYDNNQEIESVINNTPFVKEIIFNESKLSAKEKNGNNKSKKSSATTRNIKTNRISIDVNKLDSLMDLVGELVISESGLFANLPENEGTETGKMIRNLKLVTREIQDVVMSTRLLPVNIVFSKMKRILRDMERKTNKKIDMHIKGEDTELDKNVIDSLADPLMHLVRNAVDHGIEDSKDRTKLGKKEKGQVTLSASNEGSEVWISLKDDGKGLDKDLILKKALSKGLIENEEELTEEDIYKLVLLPGFSTKENVTEISGRGVGMDVVTKNIEKVNGEIEIKSEKGKGTEFILKIPLTLAILNGMNFKVGSNRLTLPIDLVDKCVTTVDIDIHKEKGKNYILSNNDMIPILDTAKYLEVESEVSNYEDGIFIIAGENEDEKIALFADLLYGEGDVVIKSVPSILKNHKVVSGFGIVGDSDISLMLNLKYIIETIKGREVNKSE